MAQQESRFTLIPRSAGLVFPRTGIENGALQPIWIDPADGMCRRLHSQHPLQLMPDLIAQGSNSEDRWRRELPSASSGLQILLGRSGADWNVPWDDMISRSHARISAARGDRVEVSCLPTARNPVFHRGKQVQRCTLVPGEHFVIGTTTFTVANRPGVSDSPRIGDVTEHLYDHAALRRGTFRDASSRIEMLSRLPDLITRAGSDEELLVRVTSVLMQATPSALAVAIAAVTDRPMAGEEPRMQILHYDSRMLSIDGLLQQGPPVSSKLVLSAVQQRESILYLWTGNRDQSSAFTASEGFDWAFCVPLRNESCPGWAIYVTGQFASSGHDDLQQSLRTAPDDLQDDVKFAELVGTTIANLRQSLRLERRQAAMRHFLRLSSWKRWPAGTPTKYWHRVKQIYRSCFVICEGSRNGVNWVRVTCCDCSNGSAMHWG